VLSIKRYVPLFVPGINGLPGHARRRFLADGGGVGSAERRSPENSSHLRRRAGRRRPGDGIGFRSMGPTGTARPERYGAGLPTPAVVHWPLLPTARRSQSWMFRTRRTSARTSFAFTMSKSGEPELIFEPVDERANLLAFSRDGTKLFTGFWRGSAIVWGVRRGQATMKLKD
jgi:hypothetical protein